MSGRHQSPLRIEGRKALELGQKRFVPSVKEYRCKLHGSDTNEHYSSSGRCCLCDTKQKKPEQQAEYWKTVKDKWSRKRKESYKNEKLFLMQ